MNTTPRSEGARNDDGTESNLPGGKPMSVPKCVGNYSRFGELVKEVIDRGLSALGLILLSPVISLLALAVRLDSPGPAFFRQVRVGRDGRQFNIWKFRGMYVDSKSRFPELYSYKYSADEVKKLRFHPDNDPRVTRLGRFIRRTSLDELPNLINVLVGDMSLVGPRPEIPEMIPYYGVSASTILSVKPGITSMAKLVGRDDIDFSETLQFDIRYVRERSLWLDIKLLLGTVWMVFTGRNIGH